MQSFTSGLRVDDDLADLRLLAANSLLDATCLRMRVCEGRRAVHVERQMRDDAVGAREEAQLARRASGLREDQAFDRGTVALDLRALDRLGEGFQVRVHMARFRNRDADRALDELRQLVRVLQREVA